MNHTQNWPNLVPVSPVANQKLTNWLQICCPSVPVIKCPTEAPASTKPAGQGTIHPPACCTVGKAIFLSLQYKTGLSLSQTPFQCIPLLPLSSTPYIHGSIPHRRPKLALLLMCPARTPANKYFISTPTPLPNFSSALFLPLVFCLFPSLYFSV